MKPDEQLDVFESEAREAFRRWQVREEGLDQKAQAAHTNLIIETGDPECERVIAALEQGWREGR